MKVDFYHHSLEEEDKISLLNALDSVFLSTGDIVHQFERRFSEYLGINQTIGVMSGTSAIQLALMALDIGKNDEVITTPMTFISTPNAVLYTGATPVFADVEPTTGNLDVDKVKAVITPRTKAILLVHLYGEMCDMEKFHNLANQYGLALIEDSAHCIEGSRDGIRPGQLSNAACFSFYATKNMTCGEGGAICVNNTELAEKLRRLASHGMSSSAENRYTGKYKHWDMEFLGLKCNMSNLQAALLINQIKRLDYYWQRREEICQQYEEAFKNVPGLKFPKINTNSHSARHAFTIWVNPQIRDQFLKQLQKQGVGVAVNYRAIHLLSFYRKKYGFLPGQFPNAEHIGNSTITLPLYPLLTNEQIDYVIQTVLSTLNSLS